MSEVQQSDSKNVSCGCDRSSESLLYVTEGKAKIFFNCSSSVFYNPVQTFNRDLSVLSLQQFFTNANDIDEESLAEGIRMESEIRNGNQNSGVATKRIKLDVNAKKNGIRMLDALSASGIRAIRYALEVGNFKEIIANDFSSEACNLIRQNIKENNLDNIVKCNFADATELMMDNRLINNQFNAIDIDPYGSAACFIDSAVQSVCDKGLLMVTCTDTAVLCGNTPESCCAKYGAIGIRHKSCHEFAIRVVLRAIESCANVHAKYIEPLLSVSVDFYVRIFVRIRVGAKMAKDSATKLSHVYACTGCHTLDFIPFVKKLVNGNSVKYIPAVFNSSLISDGGKCIHCGHSVHIGGPIYSDPIHDINFVGKLIKRLEETPLDQRFATHQRLLGILTVILEEIPNVPLYYEIDQLAHIVKASVPKSIIVRSAIINAGYKCSISHCNRRSLKTDAPATFLWDIMRAIAAKSCVKFTTLSEDSPGRKILETAISKQIDFKTHPAALAKSKIDGLLRFQNNKGKNWGPKPRAKISSLPMTKQ